MRAVEFQARVKEGKIEIPSQYRGRIQGWVRVILLVEEPAPPATANFIDRLLAQPVQVKDFRPLSREEIHAR